MSDKITSDAGSTGMNLGDSVYERLLRERIIFLGTQVDDEIANKLCAQILLLSAEDPNRDISLYINSPGGSVTAGMAIYDTMKYSPCDVRTYGMGLAASMGQFLLTAGVGGTAADIAIQAEQFAQTKREMAELIAEHTGQTFEQVTKDSDRDRWFTAQQALDYGMVDHVISAAQGGTVTN